jgi:hypothetical protein
VVLRPDGQIKLAEFCSDTVVEETTRLCETVFKFLENPDSVIALSGDHCVFCGKKLTVPESRLRGIGPECFGNYGDFLKHFRVFKPVVEASLVSEGTEEDDPDWVPEESLTTN